MSILIALPCYGGLVSEKTTSSLFKLAKVFARQNIPHGLLTLANSSLITQGRSKIANFFINNTDHEYLFFLDSDISFDPKYVIRLMNHHKDIVAGAYPMKTIPIRYNFSVSKPEVKKGNLIKIDSIGMGFVLIHRRVFESISRQNPDLKYIPSIKDSNHPPTEKEYHNSYHYFSEMKVNDTFLSEDISFFHRAKNVGFDTWLDTSIELEHIGSHVFKRG